MGQGHREMISIIKALNSIAVSKRREALEVSNGVGGERGGTREEQIPLCSAHRMFPVLSLKLITLGVLQISH